MQPECVLVGQQQLLLLFESPRSWAMNDLTQGQQSHQQCTSPCRTMSSPGGQLLQSSVLSISQQQHQCNDRQHFYSWVIYSQREREPSQPVQKNSTTNENSMTPAEIPLLLPPPPCLSIDGLLFIYFWSFGGMKSRARNTARSWGHWCLTSGSIIYCPGLVDCC